ncbi:MAG: hypothetical protein ACTSO9_20215 [Candidatus Helarchaeota archaeon]
MIFTIILGIVQNIVFIAIMIDAVIIIFQMISLSLGLDFPNRNKKAVMFSIGVMIGIFYLDAVLFDIFKIHIVAFPIFLI